MRVWYNYNFKTTELKVTLEVVRSISFAVLKGKLEDQGGTVLCPGKVSV